MYYLFTCDWLAVLEGGVDKLTDKDVVEVQYIMSDRNITVLFFFLYFHEFGMSKINI